MQTSTAGLEINISRQWTIGPPVLEIWWSCQISGGPDVAINCQYLFVKSNTADIIYLFLYKEFEESFLYITYTEKDMKAYKLSGPTNFFFLNTVLLW